MTTSRQALYAYLDRELDSFLWMKRLTRRAILQELAHLKVPPKFKTESWLHQLVCFYIGICLPEFLYLLDMGLGKSKILADLITQRIRERSIDRALIFVPNVVNMASWTDDLEKHSDLQPWSCSVEDTEGKWEMLISSPKESVTLIDYHGFALAMTKKEKGPKQKKGKLVPDQKKMDKLRGMYPFLAMDESHKLSNNQNLWFTLLRDMSQQAQYVYATTGTPFGKSPEALWSQFYLVDQGRTFGENTALFHEAFFTQEQNGFGSRWVFNSSMDKDMHRMMQHRSIRYDESEVPEVDLPKLAYVTKRLHLTEEQNGHYLRALEGLINAQGSPDAQELKAPWIRMRQIVSGYLVWDDAHGRHTTYFKENPKLSALERLIYEMGDSKIVVVYHYTATGQMLVDMLKKAKIDHEWLSGMTKDKVGTRDRFMRDPECRVFVMNDEAGGTGNNGLQDVARYMVFYESPTPPHVRKQVEKRLHRPGQKRRTFVYDLVGIHTIDQGILDSIADGHDLFDRVVNGANVRRFVR